MAQETRPLVGGKHLEYMGKPLVRQDDTICYGDMSEKYILILEILKRDKETGLPNKILIQIVESQDTTKGLMSFHCREAFGTERGTRCVRSLTENTQ